MVSKIVMSALLGWSFVIGSYPLMTQVEQAKQETIATAHELAEYIDHIEISADSMIGGGSTYLYTGSLRAMNAFRCHREAHERFVGAVAKMGIIEGALIGVIIALGARLSKSARPGLWLCAATLGAWLQQVRAIGPVKYFDRLLKEAHHFESAEFMVVYSLILMAAGSSYVITDNTLSTALA